MRCLPNGIFNLYKEINLISKTKFSTVLGKLHATPTAVISSNVEFIRKSQKDQHFSHIMTIYHYIILFVEN